MCNRIESVTGILGWPQCLAAGWQNSPFVQRNDCIKLIGKRSIHSIRAMSWIYCRALFNLTPEKTIMYQPNLTLINFTTIVNDIKVTNVFFFPLSTVRKILQNKGAQNTDDVNQHYSNGQLWTGNYRLHTLVALRSRFQPLKLSSFFIRTAETQHSMNYGLDNPFFLSLVELASTTTLKS